MSGPNSGGENNNGAYVTIYGNNFGSSPTVTVGGGTVASIKLAPTTWLWYQKMTVQLGANAATGNLVVTTSAGASNATPFTIVSAPIYFVATTGSDSNAGSFSAPWASLTHARDTMAAGSIVYVRAGSYLTKDDGSGWSTCMVLSGEQGTSATAPNAMIAYPGETVNLGDPNNCGDTVRGKGASNDENYWVFAGFSQIAGNTETFNPYNAHDWRIIGNNNMTCPNGNSAAGCLDPSGNTNGTEYNYYIYGNNINHVGTNHSPGSVTALYHGVYLSQNMHNVWFGWNIVSNVYGGRCIQQNVNNNSSTDNQSSYGLHLHDNMIHDCQLDGIIFSYINPSLGTVEAYNNVIWNAGQGPANADNSGAWSCINAQGWENVSSGESGTVQIYNNTMYACGTYASPPYGGSSAGFLWNSGNTTTKQANFENNIVYYTSGPTGWQYLEGSQIQGSNNLFYNHGTSVSITQLATLIFSDPLFVNPPGSFQLQVNSPAATAGVNTGQPMDIDGVPLPQGGGYPIGAYAYATGAASGGTVSVSISPATATLGQGGGEQFTATVTGSSNTAVNWSISPSLGTLTSSGYYTAPSTITSNQTVMVTATSAADSTKSASAVITLVAPTPTVVVAVSPASVTLANGGTQQFAATVTGSANTAVTWSMTPSVGTLTSSGYYTDPANITTSQTVTITATSAADPTKSASAAVTLAPTQRTILVQVIPASVTLANGGTQQFAATVAGSANTAVTWSMTPSVGTLTSSGYYTAPANITTTQTVTITATSAADSTKSVSAVITLVAPTPTVVVKVNPVSVTLAKGGSRQFTATVTGTTDTVVTWSMNAATGTLSKTGLYTAPSSITQHQTITITARSVANVTKTASATVTLVPQRRP